MRLCDVALQQWEQFTCDICACIAAFLNSVLFAVLSFKCMTTAYAHFLFVIVVYFTFICVAHARVMIGCLFRVYFGCACTFDGCGASDLSVAGYVFYIYFVAHADLMVVL